MLGSRFDINDISLTSDFCNFSSGLSSSTDDSDLSDKVEDKVDMSGVSFSDIISSRLCSR